MKNYLKKMIALLCCLAITAAFVPTALAANGKKVLFIGSDFTDDNIFYLSELAHLVGEDLNIGIVEHKGADLRTLAAAVYQKAALPYFEANASTQYKLIPSGQKTIVDAIKSQNWDIVVLQNSLVRSGIQNQYASDLKYFVDMIEDLQPNAKLYWNMSWALESNSVVAEFSEFFDKNSTAHYNAILDCVKEKIASNQSFDGIIYTGAAIENARATALKGNMLRSKEGNLTFKQGRLIAALAVLKGLCPNANLSKVTVSALNGILTDSGTPADTYTNNDANLNLIKSAVSSACSGEPKPLPYTSTVKTNTFEGVITVAQEDYPNKLHFPDVTVMDNGDVFVAAYENICHYPITHIPSHEKNNLSALPNDGGEGAGKVVFYKSGDNGKTFQKLPCSIGETELEAWGLCKVSQRYQMLKENPDYNYCYCFDIRDPNVKNVHADINADGKLESILFLTFWVRSYFPTGSSSNGMTYCTYSTDGGNTWTKPQMFNVGVKRGDIMAFNDGTILMPTYSGATVVCSYITFDATGKMKMTEAGKIEDGAWDGAASPGGAEASFISPDGEKTVFTMVRPAGMVMRSDDRGKTWTPIYNIPGEAYQPGFTKIDGNRIYMTYSIGGDPREVMGKVIYTDGAWLDTADKKIYSHAMSVEATRDTGDPSCATLKDGKVFTVSYDTYYRSIVGTIEDPDNDPAYIRTRVSPAYQPAPGAGIAYASKETVDLDGKPTEFDMYKLIDANGGETNYIKLRDIAYLLNGSAAQFNIKFNNNTITLIPRKPYAANGSEMNTPFSGNRAFRASSSVIKLNDEHPVISGITLTDNSGGEYNYFKLRDLGDILGFKVDWSSERGIFVDTNAK